VSTSFLPMFGGVRLLEILYVCYSDVVYINANI